MNKQESLFIAIPGIYQHFKGQYYATMFISEPIPLLDLKELSSSIYEPYIVAEYTESVESTDNLTYIYKDKTLDKYYHNTEHNPNHLVIYKSLYDNHMAYARPLGMFLSNVDRLKYPDIEEKKRFSLVIQDIEQ